MTASAPYPGTQTVLRAVTLLKAFTDDHPQRGLADLARAAQLNKSTAYRLLTALESEGLIARSSDTETYRLGPEAISLGGRALRANGLRLASRSELEQLADDTNETATLEVLVGCDTLILDEVPGGHLIGATPELGARWPAHTTSTGKAILAALPEDELNATLPRRLATPTEKSLRDRESLYAELARIRKRGYAVAAEELEPGFVAVGAAVRNHDGQVAAAISIGGPLGRMTPARIAEIAEKVKEAAGRISQRLGYQK